MEGRDFGPAHPLAAGTHTGSRMYGLNSMYCTVRSRHLHSEIFWFQTAGPDSQVEVECRSTDAALRKWDELTARFCVV
jgi:hypothetical protein